MQRKVRAFRGLIYSQFDSESEFAKQIGWDRRDLSKVTNGHKEPAIAEIDLFAKELNVPREDMVDIFLSHWSPNRRQEDITA